MNNMSAIFYCADEIGTVVKKWGISPSSVKNVQKILRIYKQKLPETPESAMFFVEINNYFDMCLAQREKIQKVSPNNADVILSSSDIIESLFGVFKNRAPNDPQRGFTKQILLIPLLMNKLRFSDVRNALRKITQNKVQQWAKKHILTPKYETFRTVFNGI